MQARRLDALAFGFLQLFGERGHHFENIGDNSVIGDLKDGGVLVFVDGDDGARAFHADSVLDGR